MPCSKRRQALTKVAKRRYRNPIILAQEWKEALAKGEYASSAALSRHMSVSRARVTQILRLLKLAPEALELVISLGDPLPSSIVTERSLRPVVDLPTEGQKRWIETMLAEKCQYQPLSRSCLTPSVSLSPEAPSLLAQLPISVM